MSFHQPSIWFLLLLAVLPLLWLRGRGPRRRVAVSFSSILSMQHIEPSWAVRLGWIVPGLRILAILLLILAIARPQKGDEHSRINTEGVAIQLIVDRSGSMRAMDFQVANRAVDRLTAVKRVVQEFVTGGQSKELPGRPNDLIGLIAFASFADSLCPLTSDHTHLIEGMNQMKIATEREESATAIGDAIALGVERLKSLDSSPETSSGDLAAADTPSSSFKIKSKLMILLTDGESNAGDIDPLTAAQMAAAYSIKIYTIGAGTKDGFAPVPGTDFFGQTMQIPVSIDEETLTKIAQTTGGQYFRATDTDSLQRIYQQIDSLEKTQMQERRFMTYKELAVEPVRLPILGHRVTIPPLLAIVLAMLGLEVFLRNTRFRSLP